MIAQKQWRIYGATSMGGGKMTICLLLIALSIVLTFVALELARAARD